MINKVDCVIILVT